MPISSSAKAGRSSSASTNGTSSTTRATRRSELRAEADRLLPQLRGARVIPVSGLTGAHVDKLLEAVVATHEIWNTRISTGRLNRWLAPVIDSTPPPAVVGPPHQNPLHYPAEGASAVLPSVRQFGRDHSGKLQALSRQRPSRDVRPLRSADSPLDAIRRREPLCAKEAAGVRNSLREAVFRSAPDEAISKT